MEVDSATPRKHSSLERVLNQYNGNIAIGKLKVVPTHQLPRYVTVQFKLARAEHDISIFRPSWCIILGYTWSYLNFFITALASLEFNYVLLITHIVVVDASVTLYNSIDNSKFLMVAFNIGHRMWILTPCSCVCRRAVSAYPPVLRTTWLHSVRTNLNFNCFYI